MDQTTEERMGKIINGMYNGISIGESDSDGFTIKEMITGHEVYIYYSEADSVMQQIRKLCYQHKGIRAYAQKGNTGITEEDINISKRRSLEAYTEYLKSDEWKIIKGRVLARDGFQCTQCGSPEHLEVHHKKQAELNRDPVNSDISHLVTLCHRCHKHTTELIRKKRKGIYL